MNSVEFILLFTTSMPSVNLSLEYSFLFLIPLVLLGLLYASLFYYKNRKNPFNQTLTLFLFAIRFTLVSLVAFLLLNPYLVHRQKEIEKPIVLLGVDNSKSMVAHIDSVEFKNKFRQSVQLLVDELKKNTQVDVFSFGNEIQPIDSLNFTENKTDISAFFSKMNESYYRKNTALVILASDGIYNSGKNPLQSALNMHLPVATIGTGDTAVHPDLAVIELFTNKKVYAKSTFTIEISVIAKALRGEIITINVVKNDQLCAEKKLRISSENYTQSLTFQIEADEKGMMELKVTALCDANEIQQLNNSRIAFIEVIEKKHKVLVWAHAPHPDLAAIRAALGDQIISEVQFGSVQPILELDLLIVHQIPADATEASMLRDFMAKHPATPILFVCGMATSIPLLNQSQSFVQITGLSGNSNEVLAIENLNFSLFVPHENTSSLLQKLAPLHAIFGEYRFQTENSSLYFQKIRSIDTQLPLLSFTMESKRKAAFLFGTGIWQWKLNLYENQQTTFFNTLINQIIQFLLADNRNKNLDVRVNESVGPAEDVQFEATLINESGKAFNTEEINLELTNTVNQSKFQYVFGKTENTYFLNTGKLPSGLYSWQAVVASQPSWTDQGTLRIEASQLEYNTLTADHHVLRQIAMQTGGKFFEADSMQQISDWMNNELHPPSVIRYHESNKPLISYRWMFILLLLLASMEWFLRKYNGSY